MFALWRSLIVRKLTSAPPKVLSGSPGSSEADVTSGPVVVPGALVPVHVSPEQDHAVYVEPNVWVHHRVPVG